ncbi:hypothetical protein ACWGPQ_22075 [Saccharomonospora azurea]
MAHSAAVGAGYRHRSPRGQGPRRVRVSLRYTDVEWAAILVAAAVEGMKPGAWVAEAAFELARGRNRGPGLDRRAVDEVLAELGQHRRILTNIGGNLNQLAAVANTTGEIEVRDAAVRVVDVVRRVVLGSEALASAVRAELL